jgi:4-hydroxy-tetrahydrodipicolinate synthase
VDIVGRHVSRLSGYAPALPTPFGENASVDLPCLERFCIQQIHAGATALVVCGTTGEAPTLTLDERREIVRVAVKASRGRVPVIAGAGSNSTTRVVELAAEAERAGADAVLSVVPYYNKPVQRGLFAHFKAVADAIGIPVIIHDVPSRTVVGLADATIARLAENPRFIGLMDSSGDPTRIGRLRTLLGEDFRLLSGDDPTAFATIANGGNGCISVTSNVAPGLCRAMYLALRRGHVGLARRIAAEVTRLNAILCQEGDPAPVKYALGLLGLMSPAVRLPLVEPGEQDKADIALALQHFCEHNPDDGVGTLAMAVIRRPPAERRPAQRCKQDPSPPTPG